MTFRKKQMHCGQHELWVDWVFYNDYLNDNSKLAIIGAKVPTASALTKVCLVEKMSVW
jgi:hypothetical protein